MKEQELRQKYLKVHRALGQEVAAHRQRRSSRALKNAGVSSQSATLIDLYQTLNQLAEAVGPEFVAAIARREGGG